ncbi:MAG: GNAT family N-acetyltransferase [Parvibaculum sp.]|nr:GNAT family N-acetyltransferase [Parvibaculum sp.]
MNKLNQTKTVEAKTTKFVRHDAPFAPAETAKGNHNEFHLVEGPWRARPEVLLSVHDDLASLQTIWTSLEQSGDCTAFQSFAFVSTWFTHVGRAEGVTPCVVVGWDAEDAGEGKGPLFIMPLALTHGALGTKLGWLASGVSDYNGPLLAKEFFLRVRHGQFKDLWKQIRDILPEHDIVELTSMPEKIGGQANPFMQLSSITQHASSAHMTRINAGWDAYYDVKRSSGSKKRDRQKRRKLEEFGDTVLVTPTDTETIAATVETLIAQKSVAFARMGVANMFDKPGMRDFYMALATDAAANGLVEVSRLEVGGAIAAANWGISFKGRFHYVLTSYDEQAETAKRGPGMIQLMELMKRAADTGHTEFDFTVGDEGYKADWCEIETLLFDHVEAATVRGLLIRLPKSTFLKVKRFIKQTPVLWQAYTRLRAASGNLPGGIAVRA